MADKKPVPRGSSKDSKPAANAGKPGSPDASGLQWRNIALIGGAVSVLWFVAFASGSKVFIAIVGGLTVALAAAGIWVWRWVQKQRRVVELLKDASSSPEARKSALERLRSEKGADSDVVNLFAQAQLEAQEDPDKALVTLEKIQIEKAMAPLDDQVRALKAQLYLFKGRRSDARTLADQIKLSEAPDANSRGMYAAVVAEAWATTGKHKEALDLLQTIKPEDPDFAEARVALLFARIYANYAGGQREHVRKDMHALMKQDMNLLGRFVAPQLKSPPELQKIARDVLSRNPEVQQAMKKNAPRAMRRMR